MSELSDVFGLVTRFCEKVDAEVIKETNAVQQSVLGNRTARNTVYSSSTADEVTDGMQKLIEKREAELLNATKRALENTPFEINANSVSELEKFLLADLQRYYDHGAILIGRVLKAIRFYDGVRPSLEKHRKKMLGRISAESEIMIRNARHSQSAITISPKKMHSINPSNRVFIVHGRNESLRHAVVKVIKTAGLILKWTPKVGQRGTDSINKEGTVTHVQKTTPA